MLQVALGGYVVNNVDYTEDAPVYHEPGFDIFYPLVISLSVADQVHIELRKRDDQTGTSFEIIDSANFSITTVDGTTGASVDSSLAGTNSQILIATIDTSDSGTYIKVIDCVINENVSNNSIMFRIILASILESFSYLTVYQRTLDERPTSSSCGSSFIVLLDTRGSYTLFSPGVTFEETSSVGNFSYPTGAINYSVSGTYNREDCTFSLSSVSHSVIVDNISVFGVPGYPKVGVLIVDGSLRSELIDEIGNPYVDIDIIGTTSGSIDILRVYFAKSNRIYIL